MNFIRRAERYAITVSYTTPGQIVQRIRKVFRQRWVHRTPRYRRWLASQYSGDEPTRALAFPDLHPHAVDVAAIGQGCFTFLNRTESLGTPIDWAPSDPSKLWVYNLHYFEYAAALAVQAVAGDPQAFDVFRSVVSDWLAANHEPQGLAWHAYPVSLRVCNWIKAYALLEEPLAEHPEFARSLRRSIATQARYLEDNLEYDLMNNHLLENGRALLNAGCFFDHADASRWREQGRRILELGLREHFLEDGAHDELSPMYHQIMLELYLEMRSLLQQREESIPTQLNSRIDRAKQWLAATLHPDGKIALLNDAAHGIAGDPRCLLDPPQDRMEDDGFLVLPDSHVVCFRDVPHGNYLIADNGPLGPERLPGHGHCDSLSYELSLGGTRMIVDSGVEQYHEDETWRNYYRGTRAHNTVVVDGEEQSEIWGAFRVARRARPLSTFHGSEGEQLHYWCSAHSGYQRLGGKVVHRRWFCWVDRRFWVVADCLTGSGSHHLQSLIHFHPDVEVPSDCEQAVRREGAQLRVVPFGLGWGPTYQGDTQPLQGWYAPEFGLRLPNVVWSLEDTAELPVWFGYVLWPDDQAVSVSLDKTDPVDGRPGCTLTVQAETTWSLQLSERKRTAQLTKSSSR